MMRATHLASALVVATALVAFALPAAAQVKTMPGKEPVADKTVATPKPPEVLLLEVEAKGKEAAGDPWGALVQWQQIFKLAPSAGVAWKIVAAYLALDELHTARAAIDLTLAMADLDAETRAAAQNTAARLDPLLVRLTDAQKLLEADKAADALAAFEGIAADAPGATSAFGIARCHEALGRTDEALATYTHLDAEVPLSPDTRERIRRRIEAIRVTMSVMAAVPNVEDAQAKNENNPSLEGDLKLIPIEEPQVHSKQDTWTGSKTIGYALMGLGVAAVGTGVGMDFYTQSLIDQHSDAVSAGDIPKRDSLASDISGLQDATILTYVGGLLTVGIGGVVLYAAYATDDLPETPPAAEPPPGAAQPTSSLRLLFGPTGLSLQGEFSGL